jgi:hypothetical protein
MRVIPKLFAALVIGVLLSSCASIPAKRVDTVLSGATTGDLDAALAEVSISTVVPQPEIELVAREVFPLASVQAGIAPGNGSGRAEYVLWLREQEYTVGIDTYSAVLCVLKLRSKSDGSLIATTIVSDETKLDLKSSGYVYALLRESLVSLRGAVSASEKAVKASAK